MGIERLNEFWPEWKVIGELGEGAFGKVYKAVDEEAGFPVYSAIKVLSIPSSNAELDALQSEGMSDAESKSYFKGIADDFVNEIKLMHTLKGAPNIVGVEAFKIAEKQERIGWDIFIRMELLKSFKEYLKAHIPTGDEIIKLGIDICSALEVCAQRHIIHRDIKPANIFIDSFNNFKLGDFGIAKELEKTSGAVSSKGTFSYMAPEVARGERYDATVDIYSLGLVLYSLCNNNRPPFVDANKTEVGYNERRAAIERRLSGEPIPPPANASNELANIILTACAFDPKRRFADPTALKKALVRCRDDKEIVKAVSIDPDETVATEKQPFVDATMTARAAHQVVKTEQKPAADPQPVKSEVKPLPKPEPIPLNDKKKKSPVKVIIAVILVIALCVGGAAYILLQKESSEVSGAKNPSDLSDFSVGDVIKFGSYEQDNNTSNGKEEIEWQVLEVKDGKALVISKYALDCKPYNTEYTTVTWESCDLHQWLNNDFYNSAFGSDEKAKIISTTLTNDDNPSYGTEGGNDTTDKVFLLSIDEAEKYFSSNEARKCEPTEYAEANGDYINDGNGTVWWWLRSPGNDTYYVASVDTFGWVHDYGYIVNLTYIAVRPALWINLNS